MHNEKVDPLRNYRQLVERVDALCRNIENTYPAEVTCHRGCDSCCRHLTLFPVEGAALGRALTALPAAQAALLRARARTASADGPCPLLSGGACLLYHSRPLICRTHGLPLLLSAGTERVIDYCPRNFQGVHTLPAAAVLDLDRLNTALAGVNALFIREVFGVDTPGPDRLPMAEYLATAEADLFRLKNYPSVV